MWKKLQLILCIFLMFCRLMPNVYVSYQTLASLPLASTQVVKSSCNPKWDYQKLERISHTSLKSQVKFYLAYNKTTSLFAPHRNLAYSKKMISWSRTSSIYILAPLFARLILENCFLMQLHKPMFCLMVYSMINVMELRWVHP